ncbi:MAG: cysteine desulfurase [candidate division Zixibacteria bacterium RBG_16_50_21]|nr:MAG: cysteine desulfurase [candidate division Zixibacteria bacterium RBG_16_50_21]
MLEVASIRRDFPVLHQEVNGKPLVYLDSGATAQKPRQVIDALVDYYSNYNANIHRGIHYLSEKATEAYENVRKIVADFINAPQPECIIFTHNTTEAVNAVAYGYGRKFLKAGDEILLTEMEHHSNMIPWQILSQEKGVVLRWLPITQNHTLDLKKLDDLLTSKTKIVAVTQMSNVLGTINPIRDIIRKAHSVGARVVIDGAQGVPHAGIDVQDVNCDFLAFPSHKMLGPTGAGVLYGKMELLEAMDPFMTGGSMILEVWKEKATWNQVPHKFEAGTPDIGEVIAFGEAVKYLQRLGIEKVREHEKEITAYALERLSEVDDLTVYGPKDPELQGGIISFNFKEIHPHDVGTILDQEGIAIRAGHHCAQPLMRVLGVQGTARASFYLYNDKNEVDRLIEAIHKCKEIFAGVH